MSDVVKRLRGGSPFELTNKLMQEAADRIEAMRWVSVDERLPDPGKLVQFYWVNSLGNGRSSIGEFDPGFTRECHEEYLEWDDDTVDWRDEVPYRKPGWYDEPSAGEYYYAVTDPVTHWMPLPAPPDDTP